MPGKSATSAQVHQLIETIDVIAGGQRVGWFIVGRTTSLKNRIKSYQSVGFHSVIALADHLTHSEARSLEESLQGICKAGSAIGPAHRRKYHPEKRDLPYSDSDGGQPPRPDHERAYSIYMAWVSRENAV